MKRTVPSCLRIGQRKHLRQGETTILNIIKTICQLGFAPERLHCVDRTCITKEQGEESTKCAACEPTSEDGKRCFPIFSKRHILERHSRPLAEKQAAPVGVNASQDAIFLEIVAVNATVKRRPPATAVEHRETYDCIHILHIPVV